MKEQFFDKRMGDLALKAAKDAIFEVHVQKIVEQDGVTRSDAKFAAWLEGPQGLEKRQKRDRLDGLRLCPETNQPKTFTDFCRVFNYGEARKLWDEAEITAPSPVE